MYQAYVNIFRRCGVNAISVEADTGIMGGALSQEFMVLAESGANVLLFCPNCRYAANAETAVLAKSETPREPLRPLEKTATPGTTTIEDVAALIGVPTNRTFKVVFYTTHEGTVVIALTRGDLEINEVKLSNVLNGAEIYPSKPEELEAMGIVAGYASPIGLRGVKVVADESIEMGSNFVAGANDEGYHFVNANYPRDFQVDILGEISLAREGDACSQCGHSLESNRGIEVGHLFKLGTRYSEAVGATFLDRDGQARPIVMGSYGIGTGRLMASIIEQHHDDKGIIWPPSVAPFQIHLVSLGTDRAEVVEAANEVYRLLQDNGLEVLYDDRDESAGVKFNDADLIGVPIRLTISPRALAQNSTEVKLRWEKDRVLLPLDGLLTELEPFLARDLP